MLDRLLGFVPFFLKCAGLAFIVLFALIGAMSLFVASPVEFMAWLAVGILLGGSVTGMGILLENSNRATAAAEASRADLRTIAEASQRTLVEIRRQNASPAS
jgi:hypothetical protein